MVVKTFFTPKALFFYFISVLVFIILTGVIEKIASILSDSGNHRLWGVGLGGAAWLYVMGRMLKSFMVSVPEVTGLITVNLFTGKLVTYGTGLHFRLPWEQVKDGNFINLRTTKTDEKQETFPTQDGPEIHTKWSLQYRSSVEGLPAYIAVNEETINQGLNEVASSFLAREIKTMKSEEIRDDKDATKVTLEEKLLNHFREKATVRTEDGENVPLEDFYGIHILLVTLADMDFDAAYQLARSTDQVIDKFKEAAAKLKGGDGSITDKDALDSVLMVAGKGVKKEVRQETHVYDVTPAAAQALKGVAEVFRKGS
jgi:hypothetical protein